MKPLIGEINTFEDREFVGPVSEPIVEQAAKALGLSFPPEFKDFLLNLGAGSISSESFIGLGGPSHLDIVWVTKKLRERSTGNKFPQALFPVRADGYGNYDCIDTSLPTLNGEYAIVEWLHEAGGQKGRKLASSYSEWFLSILEMIRNIEK